MHLGDYLKPRNPNGSISKKRLLLLIAAVLITTWATTWFYQVLSERATFKKNEKLIVGLIETISNQIPGLQVYNGNDCTVVHQKFVNGPKSCHASRFMLKDVSTQAEAEEVMGKMQEVISKKVDLSEPYYYETDIEWTYSFYSNDHRCIVDYRYIDPKEPDNLQLTLHNSLPKEYSGFVSYITCSGPAKWSYYPMSP